MSVREGQRASTIAQACAHNTSTIDRDLDMLEPLLAKRGDLECLAHVKVAHEHLHDAYEALLAAYTHELSGTVPEQDSHEIIGHEHHATPEEIEAAIKAGEQEADIDARRARRFETR
jgi:hypothetical protein